MLSRALLLALMCSTALVAESRSAAAFEIFGIKLWGSSNDEDADIVDPLRYAVTIAAPDADKDLVKKLENASALKGDEERPVSGSLGLMAKARSDREQLVAALYADARYEGVVTITIDGKPLDELPPDAEFRARSRSGDGHHRLRSGIGEKCGDRPVAVAARLGRQSPSEPEKPPSSSPLHAEAFSSFLILVPASGAVMVTAWRSGSTMSASSSKDDDPIA